MIPFRPLSGQIQVYFILFASYTLAVLQNVTVDDAVLAGAVVPQYLPSGSQWNIGNNCTGCLVQPNPSLAYNGTWHDATFSAGTGFIQAIEFSYTGSSLYIFFILANSVPYATTYTSVSFVMDNVLVGTYTHTPSNSSDYQYNVPVYANNSVGFGEHSVIIQPILTSGSNVLILFDYLIYTTDTSSTSVLPSATTTSIVTTLPSPTSSATQGTPSGPNTGAIVGGTVGGIAALILMTAFLLCYRRYKRRDNGRPSAEEGEVVDPFILSREVAPTPLAGTTSSTYPVGLSVTDPASRSKTVVSSVTLQPSNPPASTATSSSSDAPSSNNVALLEQVGLLRDEVARLHHLRVPDRNTIELPSEAPPEYSSRL